MKRILCSLFVMLLLLGISTITFAVTYQEAPELVEMVGDGELPPVEERLPDEPFVVGPGVLLPEDDVDWQVGSYGGTLNTVSTTPGWIPEVDSMACETLLVGHGMGVDDLKGNVVQDFEVNEDNTVFTFTLRKGLKWSDGVPVTTEDVRFTYEDVLLNEKLTPGFPIKYKTQQKPDGEKMKLKIIDKYTFQFSFDKPYGAFMKELAFPGWGTGSFELIKPKHHLKQFHIKYADLEDMEPYLEEQDLDDEWWTLFDVKSDIGTDNGVGCPTLRTWLRQKEDSGRVVFKRNPYYFKVDTEGNQLPYINKISTEIVNNAEIVNMKAITGELDWVRQYTNLNKMPLYVENQEKGGYRVIQLKEHIAPANILYNPTYKEPSWRNVMNDVRFRRAVNYAINREEIIEVIYKGFADLTEAVPAEYDLEKANQILDDMGMDQRDSDGYRMTPEGEKFSILIEVTDMTSDLVPVTELFVEYLLDLDIDASMKLISWELRAQRVGSNEIQASTLWRSPPWWVQGINYDYLPMIVWGAQWQTWYNSGGESGIEPPATVKELYALHEKSMTTVSGSEEQKKVIEEIFGWYHENIPVFFMVGNVVKPVIINKDLKNVAHSGLSVDAEYTAAQFFFEE